MAFAPAALSAPWTPLADISETDDAYVIDVELPGVSRDQVNVDINDREIVISGEITEPQDDEGRRRRRRSRRTGRFEVQASLLTPAGSALGNPINLDVRSTALGSVGVIITVAAGVLLAIMLLLRLIRRIRRGGPAKKTAPSATLAGSAIV